VAQEPEALLAAVSVQDPLVEVAARAAQQAVESHLPVQELRPLEQASEEAKLSKGNFHQILMDYIRVSHQQFCQFIRATGLQFMALRAPTHTKGRLLIGNIMTV